MSKEGTTNYPFAKIISKNMRSVQIVCGVLFFCSVLYLKSIFFTNEQAAVMQTEIDDVQEEVQGIKTHIHGFDIKQQHIVKQVDKIAKMMEQAHRPPSGP